ncbi:MAG: VWA domain-containing protein [Opitutales bacterium]
MTFEAPIWLALTPVITLLGIGLIAFGWRKRSRLLGQFAAARLLETLTEKASPARRLLKSALIVAALATLGLALARPQYGVEWSERKGRGLDIVFVLDSSRSMLATDLRPSRLERAKLAILDLIDRLENDRVGLVAFAGQAFLQTPPTLDYGAFRESLKATDPSILSRGGSDLGRAIEEAAKAFPSERNVKVVVLLTDGEDLGGRAVASARAAAEAGIQIFTIGIGTPEGEYLRIRNSQGIEEFVRDASGQPVRSQLDEATLQEIAQLTSGSYTRLGGGSLEVLYESVLTTLPREERRSELQEIPIERFQWLLAAALACLILEILLRSRRAGPSATQISALLLAGLLLTPQPSEAQTDSEAYAALKEGDYVKANQLYTEAMQQTQVRAHQRDALYNMGHATYQLGRSSYEAGDLQAALKQVRSAEDLFASALELDPEDEVIQQDLVRTRKVRETIEKFLEEQQPQQEQQDQENGEPSDQPDDAENQQSENQDQENSESDSDASESQDGETGGEEQNQENQSGESGEGEQQDGESSEGEPSGEDTPTEQEDSSGDSTSQDQPESESPEPRPGEEEASSEEESGESSAPVPQVEEAEPAEEAGAEAQPSAAVPIEGMTLQEAQDLLDSLRGREQILPFTRPAPGKGQPIQDW